MDKRLELHEMLCNLMDMKESNGDRHVYYQPPQSKKMVYPCIVYHRSSINNMHANNLVYNQSKAYELVLIDSNPDSEYVDKISKLPMCRFDRHYTADNLNHDIFTIFF